MIYRSSEKTHPIFFVAALFSVALAGSFGATALVAQESEVKPPFDLSDSKIVDEGRVEFAQTCVYCHGNAGSGGKAGPLAGRTDLTTDYLFTTISNGKRAGSLVMPAWKESLDETTIWKLVAYVGSLQANSEAAAKTP